MLNSTSLTIFLVCVFILIESSKPVQAQEFLQNDEKIDKELALMNEILKNYNDLPDLVNDMQTEIDQLKVKL